MTDIPQIVIDPKEGRSADELIAPLIILIEKYGLTTRTTSQGLHSDDPEELRPALITFPSTQDALEFAEQTAHLSGFTVGEHVALTVHRPLGPNEGPTGTVRFLPEALPYLILLWTKILPKKP
jgi:hypothetical protein